MRITRNTIECFHRGTRAATDNGGLLKPGWPGLEQRAFIRQRFAGRVQSADLKAIFPGVFHRGFAGGIAGKDMLEPALLALGQGGIDLRHGLLL